MDIWCKGDEYAKPTINQSIFPNTHDDYWSSSPVANASNYRVGGWQLLAVTAMCA